jgi:hypothetical protein
MANPMKEKEIIEFIDARYAGDDTIVFGMISEDFILKNTPYVGLGFTTSYQDGYLLVTSIVNDSLQSNLAINDTIHEFNGIPVSKDGLNPAGPVGEIQKIIVTKVAKKTFIELSIPLILVQSSENHDQFLESIVRYEQTWFDYDIKILELIRKKDRIFVYYHWEGSRVEGGSIYNFNAMEILYVDKKTDLVNKIESLWSEKQFRDQFK